MFHTNNLTSSTKLCLLNPAKEPGNASKAMTNYGMPLAIHFTAIRS